MRPSNRRRVIARASALTAAAAFLVGSLAACGGDDDDDSSDGASSQPSAGSSAADSDKRIGIVNFDRTAITANAAAESTKSAAEAKGWEVTMIDSGGDVDRANSLMEQFATQEMDAMVSIVYEPSQLGAGLAAAAEAGVPVFSVGGAPDDRFVSNSDAALAAAVVDPMLEAIGDTEVDLLAMTYTPGYPCRTRTTYLEEQVKSKPNISLTVKEVAIPGQLQDGERIADAYLKSHPADGKPIFMLPCFTDPAIGATTAITADGRSDIQIYTWDFTEQAVQALRDGQIQGVLYIDVKSAGDGAADNMEEYFAGGTPAASTEVPNELVTPDSIEAFMESHPDAGD